MSSHKQPPRHSLSDPVLSLVPLVYRVGHSLMLEKTEQSVRSYVGRLNLGGSASACTSSHGPLADDGRMEDNDE